MLALDKKSVDHQRLHVFHILSTILDKWSPLRFLVCMCGMCQHMHNLIVECIEEHKVCSCLHLSWCMIWA